MASVPLLNKRTYTGVHYGELTSFKDCTIYADKLVEFTQVGTFSSEATTPIEVSPNIIGFIEKASVGEVVQTESVSLSIYKAFEMRDGKLGEIPLKGRGAHGYINNAPEALLLIHFLDLHCGNSL